MKKRIKFDKNSIGAKLCSYFLFFTVFVIGVLWILQTIFLVHYYQGMKIDSVRKVSKQIEEGYRNGDFAKTINELAISNDIFVQIEASDTILFAPSEQSGRGTSYIFLKEMGQVRESLFKNADKNESASLIIDEKGMSARKILAYAKFLEKKNGKEVILYIFSPLYPVDSTVTILRKQLIYVSAISIIIGFFFSIFLSQRITKPIRKITREASNLSKGEFNFEPKLTDYTQIRHLAETLKKAASDLKKSEKLQRDVLANISHDLRTPLTMIKSYAEMLSDFPCENEDKRKRHLKVIMDETDRLSELVGDIMELSGLQSGRGELRCEEFNINELLDEIAVKNRMFLSESGYSFEIEADCKIDVFADKGKIKRVVNNLVDNAVKYTGNDKKIIIRLLDFNENVKVEVQDSGEGIPWDEQEKIWERYRKASENHERSVKGTGLGLAIVKEIVLLHGGTYGVDSTQGKGSKFYFIIGKKCKR
ncbi:MAG: sensor histidine kinase [Eubacteriales bacterium]